MSLYRVAMSKYESTRVWLDRLINERKKAGAYWPDISTVEHEAANALEKGFYLVRFSLEKVIEGGVLPFMVDEDDDLAYLFVRDTGRRPAEGGRLYEAEDGSFLQNDFWGDCIRIFRNG